MIITVVLLFCLPCVEARRNKRGTNFPNMLDPRKKCDIVVIRKFKKE